MAEKNIDSIASKSEEKTHIEEAPKEAPKEGDVEKTSEEIAKVEETPPVVADSDDEISDSSSTGSDSSSESEASSDEEHTEEKLDAQLSKLPIVLDLDETLLHAVSTKDLHDKFSSRGQKAMLADLVKSLKVHDMKDTDEKGKEHSFYIVFERPGLQDFLDYLFANFKVLVWTAATKDYAAFIVDKILIQGKPRKLHYLFVNHHGKKSAKKFGKRHRKRLEMLGDFYKIPGLTKNGNAGEMTVPVIIDDNEDVYKSQPGQCVVADPYVLFDDDMELDHKMLSDKFLQKLQMGLEQYKLESKSGYQNDPANIITRGMRNEMASNQS